MRLGVEHPESVVIAGDADVAPEGEIRVCLSRRVAQAVVEPHVRGVRRPRGLDRQEGREERKQEHEAAGGLHAAGMLIGSLRPD